MNALQLPLNFCNRFLLEWWSGEYWVGEILVSSIAEGEREARQRLRCIPWVEWRLTPWIPESAIRNRKSAIP